MVAFYRDHFGFDVVERDGDRITELIHPEGGARVAFAQGSRVAKNGPGLGQDRDGRAGC